MMDRHIIILLSLSNNFVFLMCRTRTLNASHGKMRCVQLWSGGVGSYDGKALSILKDVVDQRLRPPTSQFAKQVVFVVSMALACTRPLPESRPTVHFVAQKLSAQTQGYLSEPFQSITISNLTGLQI